MSNIPNMTLEGLVDYTRNLDNYIRDAISQVKNGRDIDFAEVLGWLESTTTSALKCSQFLLLQQEEHKNLHKEMNTMREEMNQINIRSCHNNQFKIQQANRNEYYDSVIAGLSRQVSSLLQLQETNEQKDNREVASSDGFVSGDMQVAQKNDNFKQFTLKL
jgi:hypothetical protein